MSQLGARQTPAGRGGGGCDQRQDLQELQRNLNEILLNQTEIELHLPFSIIDLEYQKRTIFPTSIYYFPIDSEPIGAQL